ncbi:hypothetical protein HDU67_009086, partial [Dinochytrium kinnereticum]
MTQEKRLVSASSFSPLSPKNTKDLANQLRYSAKTRIRYSPRNNVGQRSPAAVYSPRALLWASNSKPSSQSSSSSENKPNSQAPSTPSREQSNCTPKKGGSRFRPSVRT